MLEETAVQYSKYLKVDCEEKLLPINHVIDEMLARLEEFETMIMLVQQESSNAIGITGSLNEVLADSDELRNLCERIDALEKMVEHIKHNINYLESKVESAEEAVGMTNNTSKLKSFLKPLLKRNTETNKVERCYDDNIFKTEMYFPKTRDEN